MAHRGPGRGLPALAGRGIARNCDSLDRTGIVEQMKTSHAVAKCSYHIVWATKYRLSILVGADVADRLGETLAGAADSIGASLENFECEPDHVHVLVSAPAHLSPSDIARALKGRSSRVLRDEFPAIKSRTPSPWTRSFFVSTTGGASISVIRKYIEQQPRRQSSKKVK